MRDDWALIYRPRTIGECILPPRIKDALLRFESERRFPHLMFYGEPGLGKTTAAEALATGQDVLRLEGAIIADVRPLRVWMSHYGFRKADIKIAIIDEASRLKPATFPELKMLLEKDHLRTAVIATMNDPRHFDKPLRSRFIEFDFSPRPGEDEQLVGEMIDRCEFILSENKCFTISREQIDALVRRHYPDFRQIIKQLFLLHVSESAQS